MDLQSIVKKIKVITLSVLGFVLFLLVVGVMSIRYAVIGGEKYDRTAKTFIVSDANLMEDDFSVLNEFTHLEKLDISALNITADQYDDIVSALDKDVKIIWNVPIGNSKVKSDSVSLSVTDDMLNDDTDGFSYLRDLKSFEAIDISDVDKLYSIIQNVRSTGADVHCTYSAKLYGIPVDAASQEIDLNGITVDNTESIRKAIELFPNIKKLEMCDCGLTDDEMGQLREEYPNVEFVWMLKILKYRIRTDVQCFSTLVGANWSYTGDEKTFSPIFKYCTELRALDLGHWSIKDMSEIRNLKKLQVLILYANSISDLSPLSDLTDLMYIDLRRNKIRDVSPLTSLQKLEYLALGNNPIENAEVLVECRALERLHLSSVGLSINTIGKLYRGLPKGCEFKHGINGFQDKWTGEEKEHSIKQPFHKWQKIKEYHRYDDLVFYDENVYL